MTGSLIGELKRIFLQRESHRESVETEAFDEEATTFYTCSSCKKTFFGDKLEACPDCGGALELLDDESRQTEAYQDALETFLEDHKRDQEFIDELELRLNDLEDEVEDLRDRQKNLEEKLPDSSIEEELTDLREEVSELESWQENVKSLFRDSNPDFEKESK